MRLRASLRALHYERRILGVLALALPLLIVAGFDGFAGLLGLGRTAHSVLGNVLTAGLETGLPLAAGLSVSAMMAQDSALELQLSLPTAYRTTVQRRFALILLAAALVGAAATVGLTLALPWSLAKPLGAGQLLWLAPTLWFCGAGAVLGLLLRSRAASGAVLGGIWVAELAAHGYFAATGWARPWFLFATLYAPEADFWLANRVELIAIALALLAGAWLYLRNPEWRFHGEDA